jgi:hypothetical protein
MLSFLAYSKHTATNCQRALRIQKQIVRGINHLVLHILCCTWIYLSISSLCRARRCMAHIRLCCMLPVVYVYMSYSAAPGGVCLTEPALHLL